MGEYSFIGSAALVAEAMGALRDAVPKMALDLVAKAQVGAPVDTGALRNSIHLQGIQDDGMSVIATVSTGVEYAIPVHEGSAPHIIVPRTKKALSFGGIVVKSVHHPGAPPNKYLERPLLENRPAYVAVLEQAVAGRF